MFNRLNFRPLLTIAFSIIFGIITGILYGYFGGKVAFTLSTVFIFIIIALYILRKRYKIKALVVYLLALIIFLSTSLYVGYESKRVAKEQFNITEITVEVTEINTCTRYATGENYYSLVCKDNFYKYSLNFYTNYELFTGDIIKLSALIEGVSYSTFSEYLNAVKNGYDYNLVNAKVIEYDSAYKFVPSVKRKILSTLTKFVPNNSGIIYAMLVGETYFMQGDELQPFSLLGVAHIFAVSGLHIGFLYSLISLVLSLFSIKRKYKGIISIILLFLYTLFCGAPPSTIRAFIIISIAILSKFIGQKNDKLNTYLIALIVVLLVNFRDLLSIGMLLSFVAYFAIVFLSKTFEEFFNKFLPSKFSKILAPTISVYLATLPIVVDNFTSVSLFSSLFNLIIIPLVSIIYPLAFIAVLISFIIPLEILFILPNFLINCIKFILDKVYVVHFLIDGVKFQSSQVFYYSTLVCLTDKIKFTKKEKIFTITTLLILFITAFISINLLN